MFVSSRPPGFQSAVDPPPHATDTLAASFRCFKDGCVLNSAVPSEADTDCLCSASFRRTWSLTCIVLGPRGEKSQGIL